MSPEQTISVSFDHLVEWIDDANQPEQSTGEVINIPPTADDSAPPSTPKNPSN